MISDVDECESSPCLSPYGLCIDHANGYGCYCVKGYTGELCEANIDDCASEPCIHGTCTDGADKFMCSCDSGYAGPTCETGM